MRHLFPERACRLVAVKPCNFGISRERPEAEMIILSTKRVAYREPKSVAATLEHLTYIFNDVLVTISSHMRLQVSVHHSNCFHTIVIWQRLPERIPRSPVNHRLYRFDKCSVESYYRRAQVASLSMILECKAKWSSNLVYYCDHRYARQSRSKSPWFPLHIIAKFLLPTLLWADFPWGCKYTFFVERPFLLVYTASLWNVS